jgi:hypothetical protein
MEARRCEAGGRASEKSCWSNLMAFLKFLYDNGGETIKRKLAAAASTTDSDCSCASNKFEIQN